MNALALAAALAALAGGRAAAAAPADRCLDAATDRDVVREIGRSVLDEYVDCANLADGRDHCGLYDLIGSSSGVRSDNAFGRGLSPDVEGCRRMDLWDRMAYAMVTGSPDAEKRCREYWTTLVPGDEDKVPAVCRIVTGTRPADASCRELVASLPSLRAEKRKVYDLCVYDLDTFRGVERDCARAGKYSFDHSGKAAGPCRAFQAYRRARAAGDLAPCGDSGLCRLLFTRDPRSCDVYLKPARARWCKGRQLEGGGAAGGSGAGRGPRQ